MDLLSQALKKLQSETDMTIIAAEEKKQKGIFTFTVDQTTDSDNKNRSLVQSITKKLKVINDKNSTLQDAISIVMEGRFTGDEQSRAAMIGIEHVKEQFAANAEFIKTKSPTITGKDFTQVDPFSEFLQEYEVKITSIPLAIVKDAGH